MSESSIVFLEIDVSTSQLLQEISVPGLKKNFRLPPEIAVELRRQQILRLEENIAMLRRKQEEFHRKMEDYVESLRGLIRNLQSGVDHESPKAARSGDRPMGGALVRCVGCGCERSFPDVDILFAREPEDLFTGPIEVIVQQDGRLKKGVFRCPKCGDCNLTIKPR